MHEQKAFAAWSREGFLAFCDPFAAIARLALDLGGLPPSSFRCFVVSIIDRMGALESRFQRQSAYLILLLPQLFAIGVGVGDISGQSRPLQQSKRCRMHSYTEPFKASVN
ncbi:hypothetical protein [uncultured Slackia sp.]|uniref:hypothetical protein n=1 Tax=uncultured Slackia sp. TaxID=665903 RepID=UPI0025DD8CEA|nr:hypothetical protein [uncultured Slackia sp.]